MTIFTIIWLAVIGYCFIKKGMREMTLATLMFMTFQCADVISVGNLGVGPQVLTSIAYVVKYLLYSKGHIRVIKKREFYYIDFLLLLLIFEIIFSSSVNGILTSSVVKILQLVAYIICYLCMRRSLLGFKDEDIYSIVRKVIAFVVFFALMQWIITMWLPVMKPVFKPIFYNDDSMNVYFNWSDFNHNKRIYAMFMEPSYLACFLVGGFYYLFSFKNKWKQNFFLMTTILFEIIISRSSTAYGAFALVGMIFVLQSKQISRIWKLMISAAAILCACVLYFGFYSLLDEVIISKAASGSGITRARWNMEAFDAYLSSPIYGVGYKNIRGSSIFFSLLGELGILGLATYILFIGLTCQKAFFTKKRSVVENVGYYGAIYAVISAVICQFIACPDLDMCSLWLLLYISAIYEGKYALSLRRKKYAKQQNMENTI